MLSVPQNTDDKTGEVRGGTACETAAMLLTLAKSWLLQILQLSN